MRVLLVNDRPPGGTSGAEVHLALLADGLREAGAEVEVFGPAGPRRGAARLRDVWDRGAARRLAATVAVWRPDVVHHHNVLRELSPSVLAAAGPVPSVLTVHDHRLLGTPDAATDGSARRRAVAAAAALARRTARRHVDAVVAVDEATAAALRARGFRSVTHLELFARDPGPPVTSPAERTAIVFAGRLAPDKGPVDLAQAFAAVADRHPTATLTLLGDGPQRPALDALAADLPGRVCVLGAVPHERVLDAMAAARLVAVPSVPELRPETGPQTVLEAALRARPVVVTEGLPLADLVRRSDGGRVVPPGDRDALAAALDELLADADGAAAAGARARAVAVARHTPAVVVPQVQQLYERLVRR